MKIDFEKLSHLPEDICDDGYRKISDVFEDGWRPISPGFVKPWKVREFLIGVSLFVIPVAVIGWTIWMLK